MKSILIIYDYPLCEGGGPEVQTYLDAQHLVACGYQVTLVSTRANSESCTTPTPLPKTTPNLHLQYITNETELCEMISSHDIIQINATFSLRSGMMQSLRYAQSIEKPHCVFLRTSVHHIPFSRLATLERSEKMALLSEFSQYLRSPLCTVVGVSHSLQATLDYLGVSKELQVIHNAKDWEQFIPNKNQTPSIVDFTYVGEVSFMKGAHILIQALFELNKSVQHWKARIIGDGQDKDDIMAITQSLGISENIEFLPYIKNAEIPSSIVATKFLVLPSLTETWGNIAMEAMGLGIPVICSNCEGLVELTDRGRLGTLFERGSVYSLSQSLSQAVTSNYDTYQQTAYTAQQFVTSTYTMPRRMNELAALYEVCSQ